MKTIILLRHAKSDWSNAADSDHERPLNKRGRSAAELMGRFLQRARQLPDRVFCSSAVRATETLALAHEAGRWTCPSEIAAQLYATDAAETLEFVRKRDDELETILLVGHEPTWSEFAEALIGEGRLRMPTGAMVRIDCATAHWRDLQFGDGTLIWHVTPKLLQGSVAD